MESVILNNFWRVWLSQASRPQASLSRVRAICGKLLISQGMTNNWMNYGWPRNFHGAVVGKICHNLKQLPFKRAAHPPIHSKNEVDWQVHYNFQSGGWMTRLHERLANGVSLVQELNQGLLVSQPPSCPPGSVHPTQQLSTIRCRTKWLHPSRRLARFPMWYEWIGKLDMCWNYLYLMYMKAYTFVAKLMLRVWFMFMLW